SRSNKINEEKQIKLEDHNKEAFLNNNMNYIADINADDSFDQVSESSFSNVF
ncbi:44364_t:CDS:1, partial [Gigaspora margarita]